MTSRRTRHHGSHRPHPHPAARPLRRRRRGQRSRARTVAEVLKALDAAHPGFGERLFDEQGELRRFVNVFVADEDIRFLQGLDTPRRRRHRPSASSPPSPAASPHGASQMYSPAFTDCERTSRWSESGWYSRRSAARACGGPCAPAAVDLHPVVAGPRGRLRDPGMSSAWTRKAMASSSISTFSLLRGPRPALAAAA